MNFQCFGDYPETDPYNPYIIQQPHNYENPADEIAHLKQLLRDKINICNKLRLANDELRRKYHILKTKNKKLKEHTDSATSSQQNIESDLQKLADQTRAKIQELHNENQHVQDCYNTLKHQQSTNEGTITSLEDEIHRLQDVISRKDLTIKALLPYRENTRLLINKLHELDRMHKKNEKHYQRSISLLKDDSLLKLKQLKSSQSQIDILQNELSTAQQDLLDTTDTVDIKQKLPTIQETLWIYNDLRDQIYTETIHVLRKYIKNKFDGIYHKLYINQICHEIMFNVLMTSYNAIKMYKMSLFDNLSSILNANDEEKSSESILDKMLRIYFRRNYKNVLNLDKVTQYAMDNIKDKMNGYYHSDIACNIFNLECDSKEMVQMIKYIKKCCSICWVMLIQQPILNFAPSFWRIEEENNVFNEDIHERVLGSDLKCENVLYYVWPLIMKNNDIVGNQKMEIMTGNKINYQVNESNDKNGVRR